MGHQDGSAIRLCVLGNLELWVNGSLAVISRTRVREVLHVLAAENGNLVRNDRLIEDIWGSDLPTDPRATLSVVLSRLRVALDPERDALISEPTGVKINASFDTVDFRNLIAGSGAISDPSERVVAAERALDLWRGIPFADASESIRMLTVRTELTGTYWRGVETLAADLRSLDRHEDLVERVLPIITPEPSRDLLVEYCADSLAKLGRRVEALDLISSSRRYLRDELGVSLPLSLERSERRLLQDGIDLRNRTPISPASPQATFVGRSTEIDKLQFSAANWCITGDSGIGKTRFVGELEAVWSSAGRECFAIRVPAAPERPLEALGQILADLEGRFGYDSQDLEVGAALARLIPGHQEVRASSALTRDAMATALVRYVDTVARSVDLVVLVDDAQWLDPMSQGIVTQIAMGPTQVIVAQRPAGPAWNFSHEVMQLRALGPDEAESMVELQVPALSQHRQSQIVERGAGHPLFLQMLIDREIEGVNLDDPLPVSLLIAVQTRLQELSKRARETVILSAVIGMTVEASILRELAVHAERHMEEAVELGLVTAVDPEQYEFAHALLRDGIREILPAGQIVALHDQVGSVLERSGAPAGRYAAHYEAASSIDPIRAARAHFGAAREAAELLAWEDVQRHIDTALGFTADPLLRAELAVLSAEAQRDLHQGGSDAELHSAIEVARSEDQPRLFADAAVALCVQNWSTDRAETTQPLDLILEARAMDLSPGSRAMVCAAGATLVTTEHHEQGRSLFHEGFDLALQTDDFELQARILQMAHWGLSHPDDLASLVEAASLLRDLTGSDIGLGWSSASTDFAVGTITAQPDLIRSGLERMRSIAAPRQPSPMDWELAHTEAAYSLLLGDFEQAHEHLDRSLHLGLATTSRQWLLPIYGVCFIGLLRAQGRLVDAAALIEEGVGSGSGFSGWHASLAAVALAKGDQDSARRSLASAMPVDNLDHLRPTVWTVEAAVLTDVVTGLNDVERASTLYVNLSPLAGRMSWSGVCTFGPIDALLADLADLLGNNSAAVQHRADAAELLGAFAPLGGSDC